ncbi:MAG: hypothetical protein ABEJ55_03205 [Halanaeroarchaeum sp.]
MTIAVPRFPRLSNVADLDPLVSTPGVEVRFVSLDATLADADAVVLPGTKNTVDDLRAAKREGFDTRLAAFDGPIVGICGGYQMLGQTLGNARYEGGTVKRTVQGFAMLPVATRFGREKTTARRTVSITSVPPISRAVGTASGYEIHQGESRHLAVAATDREGIETPDADANSRPGSDGGGKRDDGSGAQEGATQWDAPKVDEVAVRDPLEPGSVAVSGTLGSYLHGLFDNWAVRQAFVDAVFDHAGRVPPSRQRPPSTPFEDAATLVETHLDNEFLARLSRK